MTIEQHISDNDDELSLKQLVLKAQNLLKYLMSKWLLIIVMSFIGAALGFTYSFLKNPIYTAELTFVLEDSKTNSLGGYASLASQFGIDIGGSTGSGIFTGDNILQFLKSRLMVEKTLLSPIKIGGRTFSLADFYISEFKLHSKWKAKPSLAEISFPFEQPRNQFSLLQDSILYGIFQTIEKKHLVVAKPDKKLSFISVKCNSESQLFSKYFTERLVKEATDFYVQTRIQRSKVNVDKLEAKADSIEELLNKKTYQAAATQDVNMNPVRNIARVGTELESRDKAMLQVMYSEVIKNLEISRMSLAQEMPIIQIVDTPILPLKKEKIGRLKGLLLGGIIGGLLVIGWLLTRRIYKTIMT